MGIYDRNYTQDNYNRPPHMRFMMPPLTPVVKWLLIANVIMFLLSVPRPIGNFFADWLSVRPASFMHLAQLWRLVTYQFLHAGIFHIFFNMLIVYFFGPLLERLWGSKRFLIFYLSCGAMGGIVYPLLYFAGFFGDMSPIPMVGASGGIYGMLAAGAIMFPTMQVFVFGIFPLPFAVLALIMFVVSFLNLLGGPNAGGEAAHLAGMIAGAVYVLWKPFQQKFKVQSNKGAWEKKMKNQQDFQAEVDRILDKLNRQGIKSLSRKEKQILKEATKREKQGPYV